MHWIEYVSIGVSELPRIINSVVTGRWGMDFNFTDGDEYTGNFDFIDGVDGIKFAYIISQHYQQCDGSDDQHSVLVLFAIDRSYRDSIASWMVSCDKGEPCISTRDWVNNLRGYVNNFRKLTSNQDVVACVLYNRSGCRGLSCLQKSVNLGNILSSAANYCNKRLWAHPVKG